MSKVQHVARNNNEAKEVSVVVTKKLLILPAAFDRAHPLFVGYVSK